MTDGVNMKPQPSYEWILTDRCNYRCSYCYTRRHRDPRHCPDEVVDAVLGFTSERSESWLVKLRGGEASLHPRFYEICERIVGAGHRLTLSTNFSLPLEKWKAFIDICRDSLECLHASFHPGQVKDVDAFIEKAAAFKKNKGHKTRFVVTSVVAREHFDALKEIERAMKERKIRFRFQIEKTYGRYRSYPEEIERYISNKLIKNTEAIRGKDFFGTLCHAGQYFFVIHVDGRVTRCYNPHPLYYEMGNMARGTFRSLKKTAPCLSRMCTCTVPANRNMICYGRKANFFVVTQARLRSWMQTAQKGGGT
jgi:MoaA/NifB/PqqE/SkfB family radical SAM enzyme